MCERIPVLITDRATTARCGSPARCGPRQPRTSANRPPSCSTCSATPRAHASHRRHRIHPVPISRPQRRRPDPGRGQHRARTVQPRQEHGSVLAYRRRTATAASPATQRRQRPRPRCPAASPGRNYSRTDGNCRERSITYRAGKDTSRRGPPRSGNMRANDPGKPTIMRCRRCMTRRPCCLSMSGRSGLV